MNGAAASGGGGRFSNTYSMAFDGVDDEISLGSLEINTDEAWSVSFWANLTSFSAAYPGVFKLKTDESQGFACFFSETGSYKGINFGANTAPFVQVKTDGDISASLVGAWNNIILTYNGSGKTIESNYSIYVNGSAVTAVASGPYATFTNVSVLGDVTQHFNGNIDEFAVFQGAELTSGNATSIYNSGSPNNLDDLSTPPTAWYRMGENGSYKSPQWLLPENSNKDKLSNYSFEFDGVGDNISLSSNIDLGTLNTVSFWIKRNDTAIAQPFGNTTAWSDFLVRLQTTQISFGSTPFVFNDATTLSLVNQTTNWTHLMFVRNGANCNLFVNGVDRDGAKTNSDAAAVNRFRTIGSPGDGATWNFNGSIDEIALWTSDQSSNISSIYNSGTPTTLPSGAIAHWKLGEDATFSTNWTVPDAIGSADGTSANMTIEDRVGDAPNSSSNSLSYNMDEVDREEDTPPTP